MLARQDAGGLRAPHSSCRGCGEYLKDYGGKEDQRHPFGALVGDVWTDIHRIRHNSRRDSHPCQLPPHLLERLILMSTDPGDVVLDPFLGTGTTAIAAKTLGRRYIGMDIDRQYGKIAANKIAAAEESKESGFYVSRFLGNIVTIRDIDAAKLHRPQLTAPEKKRLRANGNGKIARAA
jgi:site-specific DNA-methyltransferase (adenine-specific)